MISLQEPASFELAVFLMSSRHGTVMCQPVTRVAQTKNKNPAQTGEGRGSREPS
jgi:hypothetical protein